jgi:hypothetical protein
MRSEREYPARTELDDNFSEIVGVSSPAKDAFVANSRPWLIASEVELLKISDRFHEEPNSIDDYSGNIPACSKGMLRILGDVRGVQYRHRE